YDVAKIEKSRRVLRAVADHARRRQRLQRVADFAQEVRARVAAQADVIDVAALDSRDVEHRANGFRRESSAVLDAAKALFLDGGEELPVAKENGRRVTMKSVYSKNVH